ncbi:glycosyltransferase family 1 protein [Actinospica durhamensis]|uniref:Glycosyltransferase family 1 protein n=1 Tax=Actinospica durhamensis TaxID=1508375 RepID=A0A941EPU0_9ACTN|nr:glycosyltransferase [Actinospica durhamensis]MBR7834908.1 glycosyltransferase family 1 protein [Actinospica durhamensis]
MATFLWACYDGGGNMPYGLGVARALARSGHRVVFAGRPEMARKVRPTEFDAVELRQAYANAHRYQDDPRGRTLAFLTSPAVAEELLEVAAAQRADAVVIDSNFGGALAVAPRFGVPTAVILHSFLRRTLGDWEVMMRHQSATRVSLGFEPLPGLDELFGGRDLFMVNAIDQFDGPQGNPWPNVRHGGAVLEEVIDGRPCELPWAPADPTPLVLVSFTTDEIQNSITKLQRTLDALATLPVHVLATTGTVDPAEITVPANAHAVAFATHGPLMSRASLVVNHAGYGTVMRALTHGVGVLCLTGQAEDQRIIAFDQPRTAEFVEEHRVGLSLAATASVPEIRAAARTMLAEPAFRSNALRLGALILESHGADTAAQRLAALTEPVSARAKG